MRIYQTLLLIAFFSTCVRAQSVCPDDSCGDLQVGFVPTSDQVVFCEGETIAFRNESNAGWDFFIIDWDDGILDTVASYAAISHRYGIASPDAPDCAEARSYTISFRGITQCGDDFSCHESSTTYTVKPVPEARIEVPTQVCAGRPLTFLNASCNAETFFWEFGDGTTSTEENPEHTFDGAGTYTVRLTVEGESQCATATDLDVTVVEIVNPPDAVFELSDPDGVACRGSEISFFNQSNEDSFIDWTITPGSGDGQSWIFTDTAMNRFSDTITIRFLESREYTISLRGFNACDEEETEAVITIQDAPDVALADPPAACESVTLTPADLGYAVDGDATSICWEFTGSDGTNGCNPDFGSVTFSESGTVRLIVESLCGTIERTANIVVQPAEIPQLTAGDEYCTGSTPDTLRTDIPDGTWSGPGIVNTVLGIFDPTAAGVGEHTIIYRVVDGPCNNENRVMIRVLEGEVVTVTDERICEDDPAISLAADPSGGTWSGTGITDPGGTFDPADSGVGTFSPTYDFVSANGCPVAVRPTIEVVALPVVTTLDTAIVCFVTGMVDLMDVTNATATPADGTFVWTVNGTEIMGSSFDPVVLFPGLGTFRVSYAYTSAPCDIVDSAFVRVIQNPVLELTPQDPICINEDTLQLSNNLPGGTWSGPGIDPITGVIDLVAAGGGDQTYVYTFQPGSSCAQGQSQVVTIEDPGATIEAGQNQVACEGEVTMLTLTGGSPAGGSWSGPGVTDPLAGTVDLTQLVAGDIYEYAYEVESMASPGCAAIARKEVTYNVQPNPNFVVDGSPCIGEEFGLAANQMGNGFNYVWDFGDGTTSSDPTPRHTYANGGTFTLTLRVTSGASCPADTSTTIYVTTPPAPAFTLDSLDGCAPYILNVADESTGDNFTTNWLVNGDTLPGGQNLNYVLDNYLADTVVEVRLIAENFCGARTQVQSVLVRPYPAVNFGLATDDGCSPYTPEISNVSRGNPDTWFWDMGNGLTGTDSLPPIIPYLTPDDSVSVYPITLIATNECGQDTLTELLTIHPPDVTAFIGTDTLAGCQPWQFQPESFSTPGAALAWEVTDENGNLVGTGNSATPNFELTEVGLYRVILQAARCGEDADTVFVNVIPAPEVNFDLVPRICQGETLDLQNTSVGISGGFWSFGDGRTSDQLNPTVTYDSAATYNISFTGFSSFNACPATVTQPIEVAPPPPVTIAAVDTAGCSPFTTTFRNVAADGSTLVYSWDFDDDTNASSEPSPSHTYPNPGNYVPRLRVTDVSGCQNDTSFSRIIVHPDPVAAFAFVNDRYCEGHDSLLVEDRSLGTTSRDWTINGIDYDGQPPVLPLTAAGDYSASLTVSNEFGCLATTTQGYTVLPSPMAQLGLSSDEVCDGRPITFSSAATGATDQVWALGDGTGSNEPVVDHQYDLPGRYVVEVTVSNDNGCPSVRLDTVVTVRPNPRAAFSVDQVIQCGAPSTVSFINASTGAFSYAWDFGDGGTATGPNPSYEYTVFGEYTAALTVTSEFGCRDLIERPVSVAGAPVAEFVPPPALGCAPYPLRLEAEDTEALRYEWYLDDAFTPRLGRIFDTVLTELKSYDLRLIAIYNDLCRDTFDYADLVRLEPRPTAAFDFFPDEEPNRLGEVRFTTRSTPGGDLFWDLGDGTIRDGTDFIHEYRVNPDVEVTHAVTFRYGQGLVCSDTIRQIVSPEWLTTFYVPNAISPESGPEEVRTWGAKGFGVAEYELSVYSPYGQVVFTTTAIEDSSPTGRWAGNLPGSEELVLQGAYTWRARVTYVNGGTDNFVGTVTVVR